MANAVAIRNVQADASAGVATRMSLHSADPGTTGANETSAGRQTITWNAASGGAITLTADVPFTGGAATGAVTWVGFWSSDDLTFYWGEQITTGDLTFNAAGEYTVNTSGTAYTGS